MQRMQEEETREEEKGKEENLGLGSLTFFTSFGKGAFYLVDFVIFRFFRVDLIWLEPCYLEADNLLSLHHDILCMLCYALTWHCMIFERMNK